MEMIGQPVSGKTADTALARITAAFKEPVARLVGDERQQAQLGEARVRVGDKIFVGMQAGSLGVGGSQVVYDDQRRKSDGD